MSSIDSMSSINSSKNDRNGSRLWQYISGFAANLCVMTTGMLYGWPSPALMVLKEENSIPITSEDESWLASLVMYTGIIGCCVTIVLVDRIGRKSCILLFTIPSIIGWLLLYFANSLSMLYLARFIGGLSVGASFSITPMYTGEVSEDSIRGAMGSLLEIMLGVGILFEYAVGPYVTFKNLSLISLSVPLLNLVLCLFIPESPYYYLMKNKTEQAKSSLRTLRGRSDVDEITAEMHASVLADMTNKESFKSLITKKTSRNAMIISFGLMTCQQIAGIGAILSYIEFIFEKTGGQIDYRISTIVFGVFQVVACSGTAFVSDRFGRRLLLIISTLGSLICLFITGINLMLTELYNYNNEIISNLILVSLLLYVFFMNIGLTSQVYVIIGEIFPTSVKAIAVPAGQLYTLVLEATATKLYGVITDYCGMYVNYYVYVFGCLCSVVFIGFCVPETKGKSFDDIQVQLDKDLQKQYRKSA